MKKRSLIVLMIVSVFVSCKKDPPLNEEEPKSSVSINITNMAGNQVLALNTGTYINQNQDTFTVTVLRYYISNIKLYRDDGFVYAEPESYRLIEGGDSSTCKFTVQNVPLGNYIGMDFIIGVDSLRNTDGAQTGALDPVKDMFWSWSQGYIFAKLEGNYATAPGGFIYHIGGFTGPYNSIVTAKPSFANNVLEIHEEHGSKIYMKADILEWFKSPYNISFLNYSAVSGGKKSKDLATNYSDMFTITAIKHHD